MLILSLCANLSFIGMLAYLVHRRGGVRYVLARLSGGTLAHTAGGHWRHRQSLFQAFESNGGRLRHPIVFLGDSLTEECDWHEAFGGGIAIANRGISGDTTGGVLRRVGDIAAMAPGAVFLMIGVNDHLNLRSKAGQTARNYEAIVNRIRTGSPETAIYLQSILPVAGFRGRRANSWIREVNQRIRTLADGRMVTFVDLYEAFLEGPSLSLRYTDDGVHLNAAGYALWHREIGPLVRSRSGDGVLAAEDRAND